MMDDRHEGFQPIGRVIERVMDRLREQVAERDLDQRRAKIEEADRLRAGAR